ncbi:guanylate kinase [Novosphingobium mangrovi (ex Hu et al. 2023)]|uniref:Guanylate kinase n=1 Tax=Novosphingobium mangrovi (ex Hu et al. 2023) TaxID=2930094 RepID=A0ABT0AC42_9SPHN|nr:guanylate kinase [Novosphingobium mangrovi (ex Hu et al. 2023)]MCJ1960762.1 guanylate kinase [Novosphingobium mangrovi (ex Hu et al. 2023)]
MPSDTSPTLSAHDEGNALDRRGLMLILSSPSGAGKTTISRMLLERDPHIRNSVSCTTRAPRPGEVDGRDYHFVGQDQFDRMAEDGEFLEWAHVFGKSYGTPKAQVKAGLKAGQDYIFDIDWQGTQQLYQKLERDVVRIFLLPPSIEELRRRLTGRGTDSAEVIAARMERARSEISHWDGYDYVVVNDDIDACFAKVKQILASERLRRARQTGLIGFVRGLMEPDDELG